MGQEVDFIRAKRQPIVGLGMFFIGVCLAAISGTRWISWSQLQARQAANRIAQIKQEQDLVRKRLASLPPPVPPYTEDKRWQLAAQELALPWVETLRALERTTAPPIFLVGFKPDSSSGRLQLEVESPDLDTALAYVKSLQRQPQLANTQMLTHEVSTSLAGSSLTRVVLQTQWVHVR